MSKTYQSLLPECATKVDIDEIIRIATRAELEGDFEEAKSHWWRVIELSRSKTQVIEARKVIERIAEKSSKAKVGLPINTDGKKNRLKPIQNSVQTLIDLNPDDWSKKSKDVYPSFLNKITRFLFEEKDF